MPVETANEFWLKVESAGIVDPTDLQTLRKQHASDADPKICASGLVKDGVLTKWQARFLLSGRTQLRIGSYILEDRLHRGQLGDRFLANHQQLDRKVELQLLPIELSQKSNGANRFLDQAQQAARLDHPNIIHVFDIDQASGQYYLVTENIQGAPLGEQKNGALGSMRQIVENINGLSAAVGYAHRHGVIHGSIQPENILLGDDGIVRLRNIALSTAARMLQRDEESVELRPSTQTDVDGVFAVAEYMVKENRAGIKRQNTGEASEVLNESFSSLLIRCKAVNDPEKRLAQLANESQKWLEQNPKPQAQVPALPEQQSISSEWASTDENQSQTNYVLPVMIGVLIVLLMVGGAFGLVYLFGNADDDAESSRRENLATNKDNLSQTNNTSDKNTGNLPDSPLIDVPDSNKENQDADNDQKEELVSDETDLQKNVDDQPPENAKKSDQPGKTTQQDGAAGTENQQTKNQEEVANDTEQKQQLPEPFSEFSDNVDLPEIGTSPISLGKVFTGENHLLGVELIAERSIARTQVDFNIERDKANKQLWNIYCAAKKDSNEHIATFSKTEDNFFFEWTENASQVEQANYLRNCQVKLETRGKSKTISLRKPIVFSSIKLTAEDAEAKTEVPLDWLPHPSSIVVVMKSPPAEGFPEHVIFNENLNVGDRDNPVVIFLHRDENKRLCWFRFESNVSGKVKIDAELQFTTGRAVRTYSPKMFDKLVGAIQAQALQVKSQLEALNAYNPKYGEKGKLEETKKEVSKALELANAQFENAASFRNDIIPAALNHSFEFEIYYQRENDRILLAKTQN